MKTTVETATVLLENIRVHKKIQGFIDVSVGALVCAWPASLSTIFPFSLPFLCCLSYWFIISTSQKVYTKLNNTALLLYLIINVFLYFFRLKHLDVCNVGLWQCQILLNSWKIGWPDCKTENKNYKRLKFTSLIWHESKCFHGCDITFNC